MKKSKAEYNGFRISSISNLSYLLEVPITRLTSITDDVNPYYIENPQPKKNGGFRMTYIVKNPLKEIQRNIYERIFQQVNYPWYLMGSIRDPEYPRDYKRDAMLHAGNTWLQTEDISNFYPSVNSELVFHIYRRLFGFSKEISGLLTKITTYNGSLPQGASTSAVIANLVLWEEEPAFVEMMEDMGFTYSRYVDDISISSKSKPNNETISIITSSLYSILFNLGLRPNRKKRKITGQNEQMCVHNLVINSGKPKISNKEKNKIRAAVFHLEKKSEKVDSFDEIAKEYSSVKGRVMQLKAFNQNQFMDLLRRLKGIKKGFL